MQGFVMVIILMLLFFVMMFGIGFILNMLMKTTWFPVGFYLIIVVPATVVMLWSSDKSWAENLMNYGLVDYLTGFAGLIGAMLSGKTIGLLRKSGYKMF
ncbi:YuiB family protein [Paenibacillus sp. 1001270B_150601_E10]|uniref:YuiB family protein n=1 Tax=Paenibacillus sp. 1001270B_150601_E10 TaxID=2787079 RepID=UPI00189CC931|nr:YuiB family protein [Paenibacillus sp. 1001270B_150601_E10]